ncbi:hypothetical protein [Sinimarinibacterium flocculans]|uniref:hypothetical protein n=1 Tax=Sinimarinibacterium flocculans TaxID=985250 RepID=UPI0035185BA5
MNTGSGAEAPGGRLAAADDLYRWLLRCGAATRLLTVLVLGSVLVACGSSSPVSTQTPEPEPPDGARRLAAQGCSWTKVFDPAVLNFAYPDTSAHYWLALIPAPGPLGRIRLTGRVPEVRYYAFNAYDALTAPYDAIADYEIAPLYGLQTPFLGPARVDRRIPIGAEYTVELAFESPPGQRAGNTLYSAALASIGGITLPNPAMALVVYRTYLPQGDVTGGVGLPLIELETPAGAVIPVGGGDTCSRTVSQIIEAAVLGSVNALLTQAGFPDLPLPPLAIPGTSSQPEFSVFYGLAAGLQDAGIPVPDVLIEGSTIGGFFSTKNTRYAYALFTRSHGHLYVVRGKAPRFVDGDAADPQLRYWSLCQNEFVTQRVVGCLADYEVVLDAEGYYTVVVSDYGARPAHAYAEHGYNWLPWGAYPDGDFIVRNMLPEPNFAQAFQNIARGADPVSVAGAYFPAATYCDPQLFAHVSATGVSPAAVFSACREQSGRRE